MHSFSIKDQISNIKYFTHFDTMGVMNGWQKKQFLQRWRKLKIKSWQLLILFVVLIGLTVFFLRQNNLAMVQLRNQVVVADEQGGDVSAALKDLNTHIFKHMNTEIVRPIELVNTYNKQAQLVIEAANKASGRDVYAEATAACERRGVPLSSIAQCAADYALQNNPDPGSVEINLPDKNRFIYTFATPVWTPDAAGILLLITGVIGLWLIARIFEYALVRLIVRRRLQSNF
jgi:hypothetical protein